MHIGRARIGAALVLVALHAATTEGVVAQEAAVVPYGVRNSAAPVELDAFSFLVGKWKGVAKVRLENGRDAEYDVIWIGRYVLDGMAIADEGYSRGFRIGASTLTRLQHSLFRSEKQVVDHRLCQRRELPSFDAK